MMRAILAVSISLLAANAFAEDKPAAGDQPPATQTEKPAAEAPEAAAPAAKPKPEVHAAPKAKPKPAAHAAAEAEKPRAMSQSKFLGLLYSEIAKRTPRDNKAGPGAVAASFRVNSSGKIENVSITNSTSPTHAEIVKKILAGVHAPPPPSGSFEASQNFKFH
jgi:hypothetical protein